MVLLCCRGQGKHLKAFEGAAGRSGRSSCYGLLVGGQRVLLMECSDQCTWREEGGRGGKGRRGKG